MLKRVGYITNITIILYKINGYKKNNNNNSLRMVDPKQFFTGRPLVVYYLVMRIFYRFSS